MSRTGLVFEMQSHPWKMIAHLLTMESKVLAEFLLQGSSLIYKKSSNEQDDMPEMDVNILDTTFPYIDFNYARSL